MKATKLQTLFILFSATNIHLKDFDKQNLEKKNLESSESRI